MGRKPGPRYRADRDLWYTTIDGVRYVLSRGVDARDEATREFHRLMADRGKSKPAKAPAGETVKSICGRYLDHADAELAPHTYDFYRRHLVPFGDAHPELAAADLRPHHVLEWAGSRTWNPTTRAGAITAVKRAFSWAATVGHIADDPIRATKKPRALRREAIPGREVVDRFVAAIDNPDFRDLVFALRESGCRPGEIFAMTAARFDAGAGTWTVANKTRHHGEATRTIYLTPALAELSARLARARPTGPLFRNSRGGAWNRHAVIHRFGRLRVKLGMGPEVTAYALRHLFVTDALERGVPIATVAVLVGHKGTEIVARTYSHLSERTAHLRQAVSNARGVTSGDVGPPTAIPDDSGE